MVTMVGLETDFIQMLNDLIELDYDAIEAYSAAINRLGDSASRDMFDKFRADHARHTRELGQLVRDLGGIPSTGPSLKKYLTQGKVVIADIFGDEAILRAMKTNEDDTNTAYERAVNHDKKPAVANDILQRGLADEQRHRAWIEDRIDQINQEAAA